MSAAKWRQWARESDAMERLIGLLLTSHRAQTGPSHLNAYRFKSGFTDSPACDACGAAFETRSHFLLECSVLEPLREPLHTAARAAGMFGPLHVGPLLNEPKLLKAIAKFVEASGRFA
ncbi:hypothetical protein B0H14DRAFT_3472017 [Mycena olivaceomarginata]|nr:hypothetical protein B0H14DRAFT_3472017 [Mycena olivaceomarginata]